MTGQIHLYCGDGKGKTTAAFGLALRMLGRGGRVVIAQFLKAGDSGECRTLSGFENVLLLADHPTGKFTFQMNEEERERTRGACLSLLTRAVCAARDADLLVLDEIMAAVNAGMVERAAVLTLLRDKPDTLEVVLTGREPPREFTELADYVTEMKKHKHPFERGLPARDGIEQ